MTTRALASIKRIDIIKQIPGADMIECAILGGWPVVTRKNEYKVGDLAIYLEIDSWCPHSLASFLSKGKEPKEYNGIKGERLRTIRLKGQLSQGLLLPLSVLDEPTRSGDSMNFFAIEGTDVTEILGIVKYETPIPACLSGIQKGPFPPWIPKTDQERIQNLSEELEELKTFTYEITEKCEGSSATFYHDDTELNVCSRNLNLLETEGNSFWQMARKLDLETKLKQFPHIAIQGELVGPGIQGNIYKLKEHRLYVFDIFDTMKQQYVGSVERQVICSQFGLHHAPVVATNFVFGPRTTIDGILSVADGESCLFETPREGLVFKTMDGQRSFKAISNNYLVSEK